MTQSNPPTPENQPPQTPPATNPPADAPKRKRKRWWLRILLALIVLVVGLVILGPTIASLSPIRSIVLGKVQPYIPHGKLEVADWSFGWFSPIRLNGVKLIDEQGNVVVEADEVKTDLTVLKAARQKFDLTGTVVDAGAHLVVYPNGSTNLQHVLGLDEPAAVQKHEPHPEKESKPAVQTTLPDLNGDITLKLKGDVRLVDASEATVATVRLQPGSGGTIKIPDINQPIAADLKFVYDTGENTKPGTLALKTTLDAIQNNKLDLAQLAAKLDLHLADIGLDAAQPFLALAGQKDLHLAGVASGDVAGELKPGQAGGIKGALAIAGLEVGAPGLKDTYKGRVDVPISVTRAVTNGVSRLQIDVGVTTPESSIKVTGDLPEPALQKLAAMEMPGDTGSLNVSVNIDAKKLTVALPNTVKLLPGVTVEQGNVVSSVTLALKPAAIQSHVKTDIALKGMQDGKPISVEPITFTSDATATDLKNPVAGLHDLVVSFTSAFATFQAEGKTLTTLQGKGQADLAKAQQQIAQFVDMGSLKLNGQSTFTLASKSGDANALHADFAADVNGLNVSRADQPPIDLKLARVTASADVLTDASGVSVQQVKTATVNLLAGDSADQPLVDAAAILSAIDPAKMTIGSLSVTKCAVPSFPRLQQFLNPFVPALRDQKIELAGGSMNAVVQAKDINASTKSITITQCEASLPKLRVLRDGQELISDTVRFMLAAKVGSSGDATNVDVSTLSLKSAITTLEKADGPLTVQLHGGLPRGSGAVNVGVDAVQVNRLARIAATQPSSMPQVTAGKFNGKLTLASAEGKNATVGFTGQLAGLTLADNSVQNETYAVDANAAVTPAFDHIDAGLRVKGDYLNVTAKNVAIKAPAAGVPVQKLIESATFDIGVKDIARAQAVLAALGVKLPLDTAGAMAITANVANGTVKADVQSSRIVIKNAAGQSFAFDPKKPLNLKLAADITGERAIDGLKVTELSGDFDAAQVSLVAPIVISGLTTKPTAQGKIQLTGSLDRAGQLLAVLQQAEKPMPYGGQFKFVQTVGPAGGGIGLKGDGTISDFVVRDDAGKPSFKESQVSLVNDLTLDTTTETVAIKALTLNMASSKAATINVTGGVEKYLTDRVLKNVVLDIDATGEKVWPILYAFMPPAQQTQFKDTKLTGPIKIAMSANGAYPARPTWNESVKTVVAYGGISVAAVDTMGLDVTDFNLPISLVKGQLITGDVRKKGAARFAKPFTVNGGQGDFGSIVLDVGNPNLLLSIGRRQKLLQKVQINAVLAAQLGSLASVVFKDAKDAAGELDLIVQDCTNVRLMELMNKQATASFTYSVHKLKLDGPVPSTLSGVLKWGDQGILGDIDDASLALKDGIANQDMTVALQRQGQASKGEVDEQGAAKTVTETIKFKGGVDLSTNKFKDYTMTLSQGLLLRDWRKNFQDGATVELKGRVDDVNGIVAQAVAQLAVQGYGGDAIDKVLGGLNKKKSKAK